MKSKCKVCGKNCEGDACFLHKDRKKLNNSRVNKNIPVKKSNELHEFFISLWNKKKHFSEISGKWLGNEPLSIFFHHILPKRNYPEAEFDEENIILLTLEEHEQVELDMYRYEEINIIRNILKLKYERTK